MRPERKRRLLLGLVLCLLAAGIYNLVYDFPNTTREGAYRSLERQYLFASSEQVAQVARTSQGTLWEDYFLTRRRDTWAVGRVRPIWSGSLLWKGDSFFLADDHPNIPLVALAPARSTFDAASVFFVLVNDPAIVRVEGVCPDGKGGMSTVPQLAAGEGWAALDAWEAPMTMQRWDLPIRLRGYDAQGGLVYQSPEPPEWADYEWT